MVMRIFPAGVLSLLFLTAACAAQVPVPKTGMLPDQGPLSAAEHQAFQTSRPVPQGTRAVVPPTGKVGLPKAGERDIFGLTVTPPLTAALDAYMADFARVVLAVGNWRMPTSYGAFMLGGALRC